MLTPFGKELRKLRIDRQLKLGEMAKFLDKSAAFLSAVETGRKNVPQGMIDAIAQKLKLNNQEVARLRHAAGESAVKVQIELTAADDLSRSVAVGFARKFPTLTEEEKLALRNLLFKKVA